MDIKKFENQEWVDKSFHGVLHYVHVAGEIETTPFKEFFGDYHKILFYTVKNHIWDWHWNKNEMRRIRDEFIARVNKNPNYLQELLDLWHSKSKLLEENYKKIDQIDFIKLSNDDVIKLYDNLYQAYKDEYCLAIPIQDPFSMLSEEFLLPHFQKILDDFDEEYFILMSPVNLSFIQKQIYELYEVKKGKISLKDHQLKYYWLHNNYAGAVYLDEKYFEKELDELVGEPDLEQNKILNEIKNIKIKKEKLFKKYNFDKESLNLIKITEAFSYMQDERKKYVLKTIHYQELLLKEISKRIKISLDLLKFSLPSELKDIINLKFDLNILKERLKSTLVLCLNEKFEVYGGKGADNLKKQIINIDLEKIGQIKGVVASKGKVKGNIKIIRKLHDFINFVDGDILVTSMTRPEMVPLMKKCSAIITDEGGITSHAAIVSRELNIPCIIGTKIATKVLKDGDLVEVDANKGVVRKIG